jgi:hypothetical protein
MRVVHILHHGLALCGAGVPNSWPSDHRWVSIADYPSEIGKNSFCHECETAMTIPIEKQEDPSPPFEECCFCFKPTPYWTELPDRTGGQQVACCQPCSKTHRPVDVPTKPDWCTAAEARHPTIVPRWRV